jgi:hypothetical protein
MKNGHWPFTTFFLGLYTCARDLGWEYNNRPVTIAWLLGYHSCLITDSINNPFKPKSLAWDDFCNGFNSCNLESHKYTLK